MSSSDLLSASAFAKLCDVTTQTVLNWVSSGKLTPEERIGSKCFFSVKQYVKMQLATMKLNGVQSYLGVVIADSNEELEKRIVSFVTAIQANLPNAKRIDNLYEYYVGMLEMKPAELDGQVLRLYNKTVVSEFCVAVKNAVLSYIMEIYANVQESADFPLSFFLSVIFGENVDENLKSVYEEIDIKDVRYTINGMGVVTEALYNGLSGKYGVNSVTGSFPLREAYYKNTGMVDYDNVAINQSAVFASRILDKLTSKASKNAKSDIMNQICKNGFYSVVTGVGDLSEAVQTELLQRIVNEDYINFYCNNMDLLSDSVRMIVQSYSESGKLNIMSV